MRKVAFLAHLTMAVAGLVAAEKAFANNLIDASVTGTIDPKEPETAAAGTNNRLKNLAAPSALTPDEEASPIPAILARRFNPAMAFATQDIWPVPVSYAFAGGAPLTGRIRAPGGGVAREFVAVSNRRLLENDWGDLSTTDPDGNPIDYHVDAPGDDRVSRGLSSWQLQFREIQGGTRIAAPAVPPPVANPNATPYPPTQYAHVFWWNRALGLLAIQYWFYYPYNEWINHHEGDWEHVNVILHGPTQFNDEEPFRLAGYQFFFHQFSHEPRRVIRVAGSDPKEDHVMVYVGGLSSFMRWKGTQSGGSYPLPAVFPRSGGGVGDWRAHDDTRKPARFIRAEDFAIVMLPEPERLDVGLHPSLSWLRLSFFAGQTHMHENPLTLNGVSFGTAPRQPARQETWNAGRHPPTWDDREQVEPTALAMPREYVPLLSPIGQRETTTVSARRSKRKRH